MDGNKRVLIVNPFGIGDVLFSLPLICYIKRLYPHSFIGYLCNKRTQPVLKNVRFIDVLYVYEKDDFRGILRKSRWMFLKAVVCFLRELKRGKFDIAFDLSLHREYGLFLICAGIK